MDKIAIVGENQLDGKITVSGMKNSALPVIFACLLVPSDCIIDNVPRVSDVYNSLEILRSMGAYADFCGEHTVLINTKNATDKVGATELVCKMRASSYLMGVMLSRFGNVEIPMPGGCNFGARPLDLHFKGFSEMGAICNIEEEKIQIHIEKKLKSKKIRLDKISVGATINMMLASVVAEGTTIIDNCACEPHIDDLICFLNRCGASIYRKDTTIVCNGVKELHGARYSIFPDMIEALTYIASIGICKGRLFLDSVIPEHLSYEIALFREMGYTIKEYKNSIFVTAEKISGKSVETAPYPLFPTDFHPQFATLLCFASGGGAIKDNVFPTRFAYAYELKKLGADIAIGEGSVVVRQSKLYGASIDATDLRAGAALVLAGLGAEGKTIISNVNYILRGYENIVKTFADIGGKIYLIKGE